MTDPLLGLDIPGPVLGGDDLWRLRHVFAELARHGESHRLLHRLGVDEGELAEACDVVVRLLDARIAADLRRRLGSPSGATPPSDPPGQC
jgi:hypothetical protein